MITFLMLLAPISIGIWVWLELKELMKDDPRYNSNSFLW